MDKVYNVCGIGNAIVDLQLKIDEPVFTELGLTKGSMNLVEHADQRSLLQRLDDLEKAATGTVGRAIHKASGGSAANTMIALNQLGAKGAYSCLVGDDAYGTFYLDEMRELGIHLTAAPVAGGTTGSSVILITPDAERTMNTFLGVSAEFNESHTSEEAIASSEWLYVEGYLFASPNGQQAVNRAVSIAKANNTKIAVTFSDAFIVQSFSEPLRTVVQQSDLIFANLTEAKAYVNTENEDEALALFTPLATTTIMTMSERGAWVSHEGETHHISPFETVAEDDTGAGDMFAGAFLYGVTHGLGAQESGRLACLLASRVVSQLGPRLSGDIREYARKHDFSLP